MTVSSIQGLKEYLAYLEKRLECLMQDARCKMQDEMNGNDK